MAALSYQRQLLHDAGWLVDVGDAIVPAVCGGKAAGLARLIRAGFNVPAGICLTTDLYRDALRGTGVFTEIAALAARPADIGPPRAVRLAEIRRAVENIPLGEAAMELVRRAVGELRGRWPGRLAVRSSAVLEDRSGASHAGVHASFVGDYDGDAVIAYVRRCWASLWTEGAWAYRERLGLSHTAAAMAVVVQRFVAGGRAGVAFSADPVTHDPATIVIEAAWGTGHDVVSGERTADRYRVVIKPAGMAAAAAEPSSGWRVLTRAHVLQLGRLVRRIERTLGTAADVEWAFDGQRFWIVQARPITSAVARPSAIAWTRANVKEVFPDVPSPLAVSYLTVALDGMFRRYHASHGYPLPDDTRFVGVFHGRPYLNLSLMEHMALARGGDPAIVARLFGGPAAPVEAASIERPQPSQRRLRHVARLAHELFTTVFVTPRRAPALFRTMRAQATAYDAVRLDRLDDAALRAHFTRFADEALGPVRLCQMHEIVSAQSRAYMILDRLLAAWLPLQAQTLMTQLTTGLGTLPHARMMYRLMALSAATRLDPCVTDFLRSARDDNTLRGYRQALAGTRFLDGFDDVLREFGHRARFESDVMSPRFREDPLPLLRIIQLYVRAESLESPERHAVRRHAVQHAAEAEVRGALGAVQWLVFSTVCSALQRLLGHRDENRHVTTLLVAHLRRIVLEIGRRAERAGRLRTRDDVFFILWEELPQVLEIDRGWRQLVEDRRRQYERHLGMPAPDLLRDPESPVVAPDPGRADVLAGLGVSAGTVTGRVKILKSVGDVAALSGEIVVLSAIEPSLTPLFPVVGGVIAEMGGLLSHGAILAREYGLPAVVNVTDATQRLQDDDQVELDGMTGRVRVLGRANGARGDRLRVAQQQ